MSVTLNMDGLKKFLKAFQGKLPVIRVGILGTTARHDDGSTTNAEVGAAHEFGTSRVPMRSFLRVPLSEHLAKNLEQAGAFSEQAVAKIIDQGSLSNYAQKIGIEAVGIVMDAFDTSGFGKWQSLKASTMDRKKVKQILVETQQLRNSVTFDVKEGG